MSSKLWGALLTTAALLFGALGCTYNTNNIQEVADAGASDDAAPSFTCQTVLDLPDGGEQVLATTTLTADPDGGDNGAMRDSANDPTQQVKGGWSQSGSLQQFNPAQRVKCQADLPYSRYYTAQFSIIPPTPPLGAFGYRAIATIKWSVEGNVVTRMIDVGNGTTISGPGQGFNIFVQDDTANGDGLNDGQAAAIFFPVGSNQITGVPAFALTGTPPFPVPVGSQVFLFGSPTSQLFDVIAVLPAQVIAGTMTITAGSTAASFSNPQNLPPGQGVVGPDGVVYFIKTVTDPTHVVLFTPALNTVTGAASAEFTILVAQPWNGPSNQSPVASTEIFLAQEYTMSIQVSEGTRPTVEGPPTLLGASFLLAPGANFSLNVPQDAGVDSVEVTSPQAASLEVDQTVSNVILKSYNPAINTGFVNLNPSASTVTVHNGGAVNAGVTITWGIDG